MSAGNSASKSSTRTIPPAFSRNTGNSFGLNGGHDETRTRDLCRNSPEVAGCNFTAPIATLGALGNPRELLLHPNCTQIAQGGFGEFACFMTQEREIEPGALIPECGYDQLRRRATSRGNGPSWYAPSDTLSVWR